MTFSKYIQYINASSHCQRCVLSLLLSLQLKEGSSCQNKTCSDFAKHSLKTLTFLYKALTSLHRVLIHFFCSCSIQIYFLFYSSCSRYQDCLLPLGSISKLFCKHQDDKHFRLGGPHTVFVTCSLSSLVLFFCLFSL